MSHFGRHLVSRPDSRASQHSSASYAAGRFTQALSAAVKRDEPLQPQAYSPEEQLEEIEQKITLALQAIDANFDNSQRTMARDVMPKVEALAKLSGELLEASQPWLQFFMAVASGDDVEGGSEFAGSTRISRVQRDTEAGDEQQEVGEDDEETQFMGMGVAQRMMLEEQAHKGEITARFPEPGNGHQEWIAMATAATHAAAQAMAGKDEEDDDEGLADIDADIATPQLTSRFMTQELGRLSSKKARVQGTPVNRSSLKRMAEQLTASAKKRRVGGTPAKTAATGTSGDASRTPVSMMRQLVGSRPAGIGGMLHSVNSNASKASSSMATDDLMPDTSPPHTTTFTLPKSRRRIAPPVTAALPIADTENGDVDDDILDEIDSLIRRYGSPRKQASVAGSVSRATPAVQQPASVARSEAASSNDEMDALANKYASPLDSRAADDVRGLVADMEEMLDEVAAMDAAAAAEAGDNAEEANDNDVAEAGVDEKENVDNNADENVDDDDLDDIPSPPKISSNLDGSRVVVEEIPARTTAAPVQRMPPVAAGGAANGRAAHMARRTFGGNMGRGVTRMVVEDLDTEDMTISRLSPLANRGRPAPPSFDMADVTRQYSGADLAFDDDVGLFAATPEALAAPIPLSDPPTRIMHTADRQAPAPMRSWGSATATGRGRLHLALEPTMTLDDLALHSGDSTGNSRLNESSLTIDHNDYSGFMQASMDGTTTILPTREMLQQAAQVAAEGNETSDANVAAEGDTGVSRDHHPESPMHSDTDMLEQEEGAADEDITRSSAMSCTSATTGVDAVGSMEFSLDLFPPAFRQQPASKQLRELYDLVRSQEQRIWSLDDLAQASAQREESELGSIGVSVYTVLLDLLARRRLIRKVSDTLWSAF
ncbi:DASH complex subunit ask1 [Coemansia sp. Benny D115]|nr:DASH complex subunit ask1 [Coemansia sp. Benny D115]